MALAPFVVLPANHDFANLPQSVFVQVGALSLLLVFLWRPPPGRLRAAAFDGPVLAFGAWSVVSLLWATNRYEGVEVALHWGACAIVYFLVSRAVASERQATVLLRGLLIAGVLVAILGLAQHLVGLDLVPQVGRPAATFANRNMAAEMIVLVLPVALVFLLSAPRPRAAWLAALAAALLAAYLFHTHSRAAWLAAILQALVLAGLGRRVAGGHGRALAASGGFVLAVALASLTPRTQNDSETQAFGEVKMRSAAIRLAVWRGTLDMTLDHPMLGVGLGNFKVHYPPHARVAITEPVWGTPLFVDHPHNEALETAADLGIVGLGLLAWLGVRVVRRAVRTLATEPARVATDLACVAGLLGLGVLAGFAFPLHRAIPPLVGAVYLGLLARGATPEGSGQPTLRPRWAIVLTSVAFVALVVWSERRLRADRHVLSMVRADIASDPARVVAEGQAALRANPFRTLVLFRVASAEIRRGAPGRAIEPLETLLLGYPHHVNALGNLGIARLEAGDFRGARTALERALALAPGDSLARYSLGRLLEKQGCPGALLEYRKALAADPANALYRRGVDLLESAPPGREAADCPR